MKPILKQILPHVLAIAFFFLLVAVYFAPVIFQGKEIRSIDIEKWVGMAQEVREYAKTEESKDFPVIGWLGNMFSGMPTYSSTHQRLPINFLNFIDDPIKSIHAHGAGMVLIGLICFYILMCVMGISIWLAIAGAIAFAFASYNIIIIDAGHVTKAYVIAMMPLTVAGMWLIFKEKWLLGSALTILGIALSIKNGHIQITYYLAIFCVILYLGYLAHQIKKKEYLKPAKIAGLFLVCIAIAILPNLGKLYANYELGNESIRGATELTAEKTGDDRRISTGLDIDYAFAWSYGLAETMTLLIPNFYGGSSGKELGRDSHLHQAMRANRMQVGSTLRAPTYWGDQPFTKGPVYFGALVCFLFLLGMFVIKNSLKWWFLGATIFFILLSWGRNFMAFNEFLFHYMPLYNKFRTVAMSLVIPGMIFPIIGIWGLKVIFNQEVEKAKLLKSFYWSFGITGGLCLIFWLMPGMFLSFQSVNDIRLEQQLGENFRWFYPALLADREMLLRKDAFRSLAYIVLGAGLIFWFIKSKKNTAKIAQYAAIGIAVLILVDLWVVAKRYVNHDTFVTQQTIAAVREKSVADRFILQDTDPSFRVLNLNNPFNESHTSFFHKSIGGYNAAKLRRYQELIDHRLVREINLIISAFQQVRTFEDLENMNVVFRQTPSLNMLNARYIIFNTDQPPIINPFAFGNAWFVDNYEIVENADAELASLHRINPLTTAVVDRRFVHYLDGFSFQKDENATIEMISYEPVRVRYKFSSTTDQLVVFSEIFYEPRGWEVTINGKKAEHFRANWTLRAMIVPAGEHLIEFKFMPRNFILTSRIASVSSFFILLMLIGAMGWSGWKSFRKKKD